MTHEFTFHEWTTRLKWLAQTATANMTMIGTLRDWMLDFRNASKKEQHNYTSQAKTWIKDARASLSASESILHEFIRYKVECRSIGLETVGADIFEDCLRRTIDLLRETCFELQAMIRCTFGTEPPATNEKKHDGGENDATTG